VDWIYLADHGTSDGLFEHGNEPLGCIKSGELTSQGSISAVCSMELVDLLVIDYFMNRAERLKKKYHNWAIAIQQNCDY
jgi:hypothetical protein